MRLMTDEEGNPEVCVDDYLHLAYLTAITSSMISSSLMAGLAVRLLANRSSSSSRVSACQPNLRISSRNSDQSTVGTFTDSSVPLADSFTTALSIIGIWALAHKYLEQWFIWIAVDIVTCALYFYKDIPFKASLYGLYVIIVVFGYFNWRKKMA
ncbi:MAG: nicotinamide mononucleotide transporter [Bacteroidaceae bacterium]|nr:nicotinamide mononucleotide transporter [Bacteroidaceae bacterium]